MVSCVRIRSLFLAVVCLAVLDLSALAQRTENRIVGRVDEGQVVTLSGNVHPLARGEFDLGAVAGETVLERMVLELEPSAAQQAELDALVEAQHDPGSPLYQRWLTPAEYGVRFGASARDVARITAWLRGHGFTVDEVAASDRLIEFSGTAADVADAFRDRYTAPRWLTVPPARAGLTRRRPALANPAAGPRGANQAPPRAG